MYVSMIAHVVYNHYCVHRRLCKNSLIGNVSYTVAQTRHFIKHLLHDFTKHLLHDFKIFSTILQFVPRFYNLLHDFTICSSILQFYPRFYNLLHDFTICSTILQFAPRFYNLQMFHKVAGLGHISLV